MINTADADGFELNAQCNITIDHDGSLAIISFVVS